MGSLTTVCGRSARPAALVAALLLAGCAGETALLFAGANAVSLTSSGKTLVDHAMSAATDQDCSLKHDPQRQPYCVAGHTDPADDGLRCYRSIAEVTCYRGENPHETATRRIP